MGKTYLTQLSLPVCVCVCLITDQADTTDVGPPPVSYNRDRRRSSCTRMLRDPDEILRSLKAVKGELGRTMSLSGSSEKRGRRK